MEIHNATRLALFSGVVGYGYRTLSAYLIWQRLDTSRQITQLLVYFIYGKFLIWCICSFFYCL